MSGDVKCVVRTIVNDFSRYRDLEIDNPPDDTRIIKDMETLGYLRINATCKKPRGTRNAVIIMVLDESKKYSHNSPELKKLFKIVDNEETTKNGTLAEVILVVSSVFESKKNLLDVIKEYQQKEVKGLDPNGRSPFYTLIYFRNLKCCIPEHVGVPKHILMTPQETQEFCDRQYKSLKDFPLIPYTDPQILWIGGRPGQMVKIIRDSEATCNYFAYRTIV
jgi:DNA-directed RNA polymerase subunit H (RpoH/RPB5)